MKTNADDCRVCNSCVAEPFLSNLVGLSQVHTNCHYCDNARPTITLRELSDHVNRALTQHFARTASEPEGYEYHLLKENGYWDRSGEPIVDVIANLLEARQEIADDVRELLEEMTFDRDGADIGEEQPFDGNAHYAETDRIDHTRYSEKFRQFERVLTEEARYFSPVTRAILEELFRNLGAHSTRDGHPVLVEAGPALRISSFHRARVFQDDSTLTEALISPEREIGPPKARAGRAGRLNAAGVPIFYGATIPEIALAEVRPPVGSRVIVARFELDRTVQLLDIAALRSVLVEGSYFDPTYLTRLQHAAFLRIFSERFTSPVMPDHETFEYLATQAIGDYLAHETDPPLDGILYASSQSPAFGYNVALFHKASRVAHIEPPEGIKSDVVFGWPTDDDYEIDYTVFEKVPMVPLRVPMASKAAYLSDPDYSAFADSDARPITLRIDANSLKVHHINAVSIQSTSHTVARIRREERPADF